MKTMLNLPVRTLLGSAALLGAMAVGSGCNSLMDPSELTQAAGRPRGSRDALTVPILERLDPALEQERIEFSAANLPTAEDLRAPLGDYGISRNDVLNISIGDIQTPGVETTKQTRVSETGNISLPYIGQIQAEGLTEIELERAIIQRYGAAKIVENPNVSVQVYEARGRAYSITGAVRNPNVYAIPEADYRVLNALTAAGGTDSPFNRTLYIIRRLDERPRPAVAPDDMGTGGPVTVPGGTGGTGTGTGTPRPGGTTGPSGTGTDDLAPRPRSEIKVQNSKDAVAAARATRREKVLLMTQAQPGRSQDDGDRIINLDGQELPARRPESDDTRTTTTPPPARNTPSRATGSGATGSGTTGRTGARTGGAAGAGAAAGAPSGASGAASAGTSGTMSAAGEGRRATGSSGTFAFDDLAPPPETRIIRIPLDELRKGELRYNIVIRPRDTLVVPYAEIGTYYMGGHVARPGAYTLNGQRVTLMDAVIAASMLDQLAIPDRTDLIRRLGPDRQLFVRVNLTKVFAGQAPDIYLKPDDKVLVGTNAVAPFLAALRNAFRFTYGAGFLYDRNFAYSRNIFRGQ